MRRLPESMWAPDQRPQCACRNPKMGMLDNLTIRSDSAKKAYADEVQAGNFISRIATRYR